MPFSFCGPSQTAAHRPQKFARVDWQSGWTACCLRILTVRRGEHAADVPSVMDPGKGADVPSHDGAPAKENRLGRSQSLSLGLPSGY